LNDLTTIGTTEGAWMGGWRVGGQTDGHASGLTSQDDDCDSSLITEGRMTAVDVNENCTVFCGELSSTMSNILQFSGMSHEPLLKFCQLRRLHRVGQK
jgi:hypothetical protein